ncbi:MAG TPA: YceI family protein [Candidatus Bathyarchaeia archaeon]|nr:YceI family protein [Candidatus Bathyarchaeia archaeon]
MPSFVGLACLALASLGSSPAFAETARWVPVGGGQSLVSFNASFPPADFSGYGRDVTGEFELDASDLGQGVTGRLVVQVATISTGSDGRDKDMLKLLAADRFPTMFFVIQTVDVPSFPLGVGEHTDTLLTIQGRLSIAGVERVKRFSGRVRLKQGRLWVRGETRFKMSDFGIKPPQYLLFRVKDEVGVGFDVTLERQPQTPQ